MDGFTRGRPVRPADAVGQVEPRRNRDSLFLLARVRLGAAGQWTDVRVRNLSAGGLMV